MAKFWGVECKGCGMIHPTAMQRPGDLGGRCAPNEPFQYVCPHDNTQYSYEHVATVSAVLTVML
jgi:hypothetical protein